MLICIYIYIYEYIGANWAHICILFCHFHKVLDPTTGVVYHHKNGQYYGPAVHFLLFFFGAKHESLSFYLGQIWYI